ncbi:hypothetical protein K1719_041305 [Acacia pycnantha]|nr:hypothetical protein K1719_041305 [Acacia pycnantha]
MVFKEQSLQISPTTSTSVGTPPRAAGVVALAHVKFLATWDVKDDEIATICVEIQTSERCFSQYTSSLITGGFIWMMILILAAVSVGGYAFYKYRVQSYMDSEIRAIMARREHISIPLSSQRIIMKISRGPTRKHGSWKAYKLQVQWRISLFLFHRVMTFKSCSSGSI